MRIIAENSPEAAPHCPLHPKIMGPSYPLLAIATISLFAAIFGIFDGLRQLENAHHDVQKGYRAIAAAGTIWAVAQNLENSQLAYLLSGDARFLKANKPIRLLARSESAWPRNRDWLRPATLIAPVRARP